MNFQAIRFGLALLGAALAPGLAVAAAAPVSILGVWLTNDNSEVTIAACPEEYCGVLTRVAKSPADYAKLSPADKKAVDAQVPAMFPDSKNKDAALRMRSLVGLKMFVVHTTKKPTVFEGTLYNPQDGGTYDGNLQVEGQDKILLSGCMFKVLCKSQEWTRVTPAK